LTGRLVSVKLWPLAFPLHINTAMTELITRSGAWLLQRAATLPDTVVMQAPARDWFDTTTGIASMVTAVLLLVFVVVLAVAAWSLLRSVKKVQALLERDITPLTRRAQGVIENLNHITTSIRGEVDQVNATIASANRGLQQAVEVTEKRIGEFNALLHVAQEEAEQAFVSTAAAVRGVRTGAAAFGELQAADDEIGAGGEDDDGDDDEFDEDAGDPAEERDADAAGRGTEQRGAAARPRVRARHKRRG
jgi:uncharacterized protein YoxC